MLGSNGKEEVEGGRGGRGRGREVERERKGAEGIGSVFGTRGGREQRRDWLSRAVMIPASVGKTGGAIFAESTLGIIWNARPTTLLCT